MLNSAPPFRHLIAISALLVLSAPALAEREKSAPVSREIASRSAAGALIGASDAALSSDGRYVAFVANSTGQALMLRDRVLQSSRRIDATIGNVAANGNSGNPAMAAGDTVYFDSYASNLEGGHAAHSGRDVFRRVGSAATERLSKDSNGFDIAGATDCFDPDVDDAQTRVVFSCAMSNGSRQVFVRSLASGQTDLVSTNTLGNASTVGSSDKPAISPDGRYVAFVSTASDLVAGDSNGLADAFVRDLQGGSTVRVSLTEAGVQITQGSVGVTRVDVANGCQVAFDHDGAGITSTDLNASNDVFATSCTPGAVRLLSAGNGGQSAAGDSFLGNLGGEGTVFASFSSDAALGGGDDFTTGSDSYVAALDCCQPRQANLYEVEGRLFDGFALAPRLSSDGAHLLYIGAGGAVSDQSVAVRNPAYVDANPPAIDVTAFGSADSFAAAVSADGSKIVFSSDSAGFDRGWLGRDSDNARDVYVFDVGSQCVEQVSMSDGVRNGGNCNAGKAPAFAKGLCAAPEICSAAIEPSIDGSGQNVVFVTDQAAVAKFANETPQQRGKRLKGAGQVISLRNLLTGRTYVIGSATSSGAGSKPRLAADGLSLTWVSSAALDADDSNADDDVYRIDLNADGSPIGTPSCVSCRDENGDPVAAGGSTAPVPSADGMVIAFSMPNGAGGRDIALRNLQTGTTRRIGSNAPASGRNSGDPSIDNNGQRLAFRSASALDANDTNGLDDIYLFDVGSGALNRISRGDLGEVSNGPSRSPALSGDGRSIAYSTGATNIGAAEYPDGNGKMDIVVQRIPAESPVGNVRRKYNITRQGGISNGDSQRPVLDQSGSRVVFDSAASNLLGSGADTNASLDVFLDEVSLVAVDPSPNRIFLDGFE